MLWFGGSIAEAVNLSKSRNAIFVVFVEGDNDLSAEMATTLDEDSISKKLSDENNFLTIKLKSGSENYTHFAQIYQFVPVPSLFFIGRHGEPLEVVCAGVAQDNLAKRIDVILQHHRKDNPLQLAVQPSTSSHNLQEETTSFLQAESANLANEKKDEEVASYSLPIETITTSVKNNFKVLDEPYEDEDIEFESERKVTNSVVIADSPEDFDLTAFINSQQVAEEVINDDVDSETQLIDESSVIVTCPDDPVNADLKLLNTCQQAEDLISIATELHSVDINNATMASPFEDHFKMLDKPHQETTSNSIEAQPIDIYNVAISSLVENEFKVLDKPSDDQECSASPAEPSLSQPIPPQEAAVRAEAASKQRPRDDGPETSSGPSAKIQKTEHSPSEDQEYEVVCTDDVCEKRPVQKTEEKMTLPPAEDSKEMEEKLKRTKELIEAKRMEKEQQEKELERKRELERRQTGQGVAELKRWQHEQEMKQLQEDRKREKQEENQARQRVLQQIAQDRAERAARNTTSAVPAAALPVQPVQENTPIPGDVANRARIQFKLSDGTSHSAQFSTDTRLGHVRQYVAENLQLEPRSFALWTSFPRTELTDDSATLQGLHLAPSAALLVLPTRPVATHSYARIDLLTNFITKLFTSFILVPTQQVWNYIRGRLFPDRAIPRVTTDEPRPPAAPGLRYRPRTNIHRLTGDPSDDDNNTWNGNSTQQM